MATTRTTKPKPAAKAVPPAAKAAAAPAPKAVKAAVRKPAAKVVKPAEPVVPVETIAAIPEAAVTAVEATVEKIETTAAEAPPLVEAAVETVAEVAEKSTATVREKTVKAVKAVETTLKAAEKTVEKAVKAGRKTADKAAKAGTEAITKTFEQAFATSKEKYETVMQSFTDISAVGRENMDAVVSAGTVFAKGIEAVNAEIAAISKRNMEDSVAAIKALAAAKSAKEYFELQSDLMKTSWDHIVADTTKIGEMLGEYSKDAMAPIQSRLTAAMEKLSKPLTL
jgi:phasin family protein